MNVLQQPGILQGDASDHEEGTGVALENPRLLKDVHLKVALRAGATTLDAIGFGLGVAYPPESLPVGPVDVVVKLERNEWRGVARPQAQLLDLRPSERGRS